MRSAEYQEASLDVHCDEAEQKAFEALASYKFWMFGYWAAIWVHLNKLREKPRPSPFRQFVHAARTELGKRGQWPRQGKRAVGSRGPKVRFIGTVLELPEDEDDA